MINSQKSQVSNNHQHTGKCVGRHFSGAGIAPLGILTKTAPTLIQSVISAVRIKRQHDYILQDRARELLPKERVSACLIKRIDKSYPVQVAYNPNTQKTHYHNVQRCGSIFHCPVCAKIVTEKRRAELKQATKTWRNMGGFLYFMTLTTRHHKNTHLRTLKAGQTLAKKKFFTGRKAEQLFSELGKCYQITANEITFGCENGFHPHTHLLIFSDKQLSGFELYKLQHKLALHWQNACRLAKIEIPDLKHGLDLKDGSYAEDYISKWGLEEEMTKSHLKRGKLGSLTPFDLLHLSIEDEPLYDNVRPSKLFQEYALVFKNTRQLSWSKGLKKLLKIVDVEDEELAKETDRTSFIVHNVSALIFALVRKNKVRHLYLDWIKEDIVKYGLDNDAKLDYADDYNNSVVKQNIDLLLLKELE
jgi:hypothetical protein